MSRRKGSLAELFERLRRRAPEYLDLITAETDEEFSQAFSVILARAVEHLETNSRNLQDLGEEGLSGVLAGCLSMPGLTVTQERNSNGHVDLTIEADHCFPNRRILGEAKIYSGPAYHMNGVRQLLGKYCTGREMAGLLINYVRARDIAGITIKLREAMDASLPEGQTGCCEAHPLRWSFSTQHKHSSGSIINLTHIGCNLCPP